MTLLVKSNELNINNNERNLNKYMYKKLLKIVDFKFEYIKQL